MTVEQENRIRVRGEEFAEKVKQLIHEGNVRRLIIRNDKGHTVMEIPVTAGVVAAIAAPVVTAIGAIAALASDWSIEVERQEHTGGRP
ncbi:DUF4342 domain-containing protein [Lentzea flava]|uniref:DUF4342 domain-containing protein n=1 Tax=Lentzea flava TaxID=103732 RepID=A0ABQ2URB6_9PSEU|nr:DUF4342 domain-containing protein [Lentzea flava]MCP2197307.1 protein of unknown function (DUF4342) [Lentzea flava]GGU50052.1 hypothetical protein GCM10010178_48450 [Lentzea flava]